MASEHLEKARAALVDARDNWKPGDVTYHDLLAIAGLQAELAQASALERIADALEGRPASADLTTVVLSDA